MAARSAICNTHCAVETDMSDGTTMNGNPGNPGNSGNAVDPKREAVDRRIPVELVTGFLGSGKTTLINAVLREPSFAGSLVIVNEFGEVGIDQQLFTEAADDVVLLDSGCLCCAATGSLKDTLIDLMLRRAKGALPDFSRIIVETSGLANPAPLVGALLGDSALTSRFRLHQVLTLIDAMHGRETLTRYREARYQVAHADRLLITKAQMVDESVLRATQEAAHALNPHAVVELREAAAPAAGHFDATTAEHTRGGAAQRLPESLLRGPMQPQYASEEGAQGQTENGIHDASFTRIRSYVIRLNAPLDWDAYAQWTRIVQQRFRQRLLRCKGVIAIGERDTKWVVQGVQGYFSPPQRMDAAVASGTADGECGVLVCIAEGVSPEEIKQTLAPLAGAQAELAA
jgi:G3E family GTPase